MLVIGGKSREKWITRKSMTLCMWVDNISMGLGERGWRGFNWIVLSQDGDKWRALVNAVMNLQTNKQIKRTMWPQSMSELYRPSDRRMSTKLVPTFCGYGVSRGQRDRSLWL
jgi:hypothetical protein